MHRQLLCKQRLSIELENDRKRLTQMQREINTLRSPIPAGGTTRLIDEIQRLRHSCKQMVQEVEEAGPYSKCYFFFSYFLRYFFLVTFILSYVVFFFFYSFR